VEELEASQDRQEYQEEVFDLFETFLIERPENTRLM
jgi:hypothetical protein